MEISFRIKTTFFLLDVKTSQLRPLNGGYCCFLWTLGSGMTTSVERDGKLGSLFNIVME